MKTPHDFSVFLVTVGGTNLQSVVGPHVVTCYKWWDPPGITKLCVDFDH